MKYYRELLRYTKTTPNGSRGELQRMNSNRKGKEVNLDYRKMSIGGT